METYLLALRLISRCVDAQRRLVYERLREWPSTCQELEDHLHLSHESCSARIRGLFLDGWVDDSNQRRLTRSKRPATVWHAPNRGEAEADVIALVRKQS